MKILNTGNWKKTFDKLFKDKKTRLLVIVGIAGILLIFISDLFTSPTTTKSDAPSFDNTTYNEQYVQKLQDDLTALISKIDGVGQVEVLVTLETGVQYVYATDYKKTDDSSQSSTDAHSQKSSSESSIIIIEGQNGKEPIVLKRIEPTVQGVVVVCQGAGDVRVQQAVTDAVTTVCGIKTNRVSVAKMTKLS